MFYKQINFGLKLNVYADNRKTACYVSKIAKQIKFFKEIAEIKRKSMDIFLYSNPKKFFNLKNLFFDAKKIIPNEFKENNSLLKKWGVRMQGNDRLIYIKNINAFLRTSPDNDSIEFCCMNSIPDYTIRLAVSDLAIFASKNLYPLHASTIYDKQTISFVGQAGAGKTTAVLKSLRNGARLISEYFSFYTRNLKVIPFLTCALVDSESKKSLKLQFNKHEKIYGTKLDVDLSDYFIKSHKSTKLKLMVFPEIKSEDNSCITPLCKEKAWNKLQATLPIYRSWVTCFLHTDLDKWKNRNELFWGKQLKKIKTKKLCIGKDFVNFNWGL